MTRTVDRGPRLTSASATAPWVARPAGLDRCSSVQPGQRCLAYITSVSAPAWLNPSPS
jgi:hypothetical protein